MAKTLGIKDYIKRTEEFRKWFAKIPADQVNLNFDIDISDTAWHRFKNWLIGRDVRADLIEDRICFDSDEEDTRQTRKAKIKEMDFEDDEAKCRVKGEQFAVPVNCGTVGCVRGWSEWSYMPLVKAKEDCGEEFFGTNRYQTLTGDILFAERKDAEIDDKQEALRRLDLRIIELKAKAGLL